MTAVRTTLTLSLPKKGDTLMRLEGNTILITGGSEGIGFEMARALTPKNTVIICGRSKQKLLNARQLLPEIHIEVCDITIPVQRNAMVTRILNAHPGLNVLINNAGAKQSTDLLHGSNTEAAMTPDMALNFTAPVALTTALLPHLQKQPHAAVISMSSGLVYLPKAAQAFYCAAKAALHSYSQSLSWVLRDSAVDVYEIFLTLVDTNFHQGKLPTNIPAISAGEAARVSIQGLRRGKKQIHIGKAGPARWLSVLAYQRGMAVVNR